MRARDEPPSDVAVAAIRHADFVNAWGRPSRVAGPGRYRAGKTNLERADGTLNCKLSVMPVPRSPRAGLATDEGAGYYQTLRTGAIEKRRCNNKGTYSQD